MVSVWGLHDTQGYGSTAYSGSGWYRIVLPFDQLKRNGWQAGYGIGLPTEFDPAIIVGQRMHAPGAVELWRMLAGHYKLAYEIDDNPFALDPVNWLAKPVFENREVHDAVRGCAAVSDLVTVSTEPLAQVFRAFSEHVVVLPNCIPGALLERQRPRHPKVTVGWMGGVSHGRDLALIARVWREVMDETGARGHFVGADYRDMLRPHGFEATGWISEPRETHAAIDFDIGLAPLSGHEFNNSKSAIKVMEYAALGIPAIASDHSVYREHVIDGVTGFLCTTRKEWRDRLRLLIADRALREAMGAQARELARTWVIERHWPQWAAAYQGLLTRE